jgi:hypothetical protein
MVDHNYRVRLKTQTAQHVLAATVEAHGDHLVFVNSKGQLTALFLRDLVRSWNMLPNTVPDDTALVTARVSSQLHSLHAESLPTANRILVFREPDRPAKFTPPTGSLRR